MKKLILIFLTINLFSEELFVEQLFNVKFTKVKKINFSENRDFYGESKIDESKIRDITLRFDGFIDKLTVNKTFEFIKRGDKLFDIYSPEIFLAQNELINIGNKNKRLQKSIIKKLELLEIDKRVIKEIEKSKKPKENINIYSKFSGFVIEKNINSGGFTKKGKILYKIANFSKLWVIGKVYEKDLGFLEKNLKAKISFDGVDKIYSSKVDFIYPQINSDKTIDVRFIINNSDLKIFPNAFAKVKILKDSKDILVLPKSAVVSKGSKHIIFIAGEYEGEYEAKEIKARRLNSKLFEVISGIDEGESVVDNSLFLFDSDVQINGGNY